MARTNIVWTIREINQILDQVRKNVLKEGGIEAELYDRRRNWWTQQLRQAQLVLPKHRRRNSLATGNAVMYQNTLLVRIIFERFKIWGVTAEDLTTPTENKREGSVEAKVTPAPSNDALAAEETLQRLVALEVSVSNLHAKVEVLLSELKQLRDRQVSAAPTLDYPKPSAENVSAAKVLISTPPAPAKLATLLLAGYLPAQYTKLERELSGTFRVKEYKANSGFKGAKKPVYAIVSRFNSHSTYDILKRLIGNDNCIFVDGGMTAALKTAKNIADRIQATAPQKEIRSQP